MLTLEEWMNLLNGNQGGLTQEDADKAMDRAKKVTDFAKKAVGVTEKLSQIAAKSDSVVQMKVRMSVINDGAQTDAELRDKVYGAAQRSGARYTDTVSAVSQLSGGAGNAFQSNDEMIAFVEQFNKTAAASGASQGDTTAAMNPLVQGMSSGTFGADQLNSIISTAPLMGKSIEEAMGWAEGSLQSYAAKGQVTAGVVKNAMFAMSDETDARFANTPRTWEQTWSNIVNRISTVTQPLLELVNLLVNNWAVIEPIILGIATAIGVYAAATGLAALKTVLMAAGTTANTIAMAAYNIAAGIFALVTGNASFAMTLFSSALKACPLLWIALLIGIVVAAIAIWINHVGGVQVAWIMAVNGILNAAGFLQIGFFTAIYAMMDAWAGLSYKIAEVKVWILNSLGDLRANGLMILQDFVNGAVDSINSLITMTNKITGFSIDTIQHVEFGTSAKIKNEAEKAARNADLAQKKADKDSEIRERQAKLDKMQSKYNADKAKRQDALEKAKKDAASKKTGASGDKISSSMDNLENYSLYSDGAGGAGAMDNLTNQAANSGNLAATAANTGQMANSMSVSEEDLKYLRDVAERDIINRFTTAELKVDMSTYASISSDMDLDGIVSGLEAKVGEMLVSTAEGVHI